MNILKTVFVCLKFKCKLHPIFYLLSVRYYKKIPKGHRPQSTGQRRVTEEVRLKPNLSQPTETSQVKRVLKGQHAQRHWGLREQGILEDVHVAHWEQNK